MSVVAVGWAFQQELPPVPKLVLVALCERANSETGQCWPGIEVVAKAVGLSPRSVVTYIGALVRNGFVMRQAMRGKDGRKRNNHYWILFDRQKAPWIGPGGQVEELPASENDEDEATAATESEPHANPAHGDHVQTDSHGPRATVCAPLIRLEPEEIEPSESEQVDSARARPQAPPDAPQPSPQADRPKAAGRTRLSGFDPDKRNSELERLKAAEEARKPAFYAVIEGSEPWFAWVRHGHPSTLTSWVEVNGKRHRGWCFRTLYPPQKTGPPPDAKTG